MRITASTIELEKAARGSNQDSKNPIVIHDAATDRYGLNYSELIGPMIKAMQEITSLVRGIEGRLVGTDETILEMQKKLDRSQKENLEMKAYLCAKDADAPFCVH